MSDQRPNGNPDRSEPHDVDSELDDLELELGELARELDADDLVLVEPPDDLWDAIVRQITDTSAEPLQRVDSDSSRQSMASVSTIDRPQQSQPRFRPGLMASAAAIALLLIGGVFLVSRRGDNATVVAQADITNEGLPVAYTGSGAAAVKRDGTGLYLDLDVPELPTIDGQDAYYEVWMIDADVSGMVSLGVVTSSGRVDLPSDIDPEAFPVVDISVEPLDGDPTHSGQSILRGVLNPTEQT